MAHQIWWSRDHVMTSNITIENRIEFGEKRAPFICDNTYKLKRRHGRENEIRSSDVKRFRRYAIPSPGEEDECIGLDEAVHQIFAQVYSKTHD